MRRWLSGEFVQAVKAVQGWKRTSIHEVVDSLVMSANKTPKSNTAAKYLVVNGMPLLARFWKLERSDN